VLWFAFIRHVPDQASSPRLASKGETADDTYVQQRVSQGGVPTTPNVREHAPANTFELAGLGWTDWTRTG
jgi:hypothetical protein